MPAMRHFPPADAGPEPPPDIPLRRCQVRAMLDLGRIHAVISRRAKTLFEQEGLEDITPGQANVLMVLFGEKRPMTARSLHRALGVSEVTISRFVSTLEKRGWVARHRDPNDARAMLVEPTPRAREALPCFIRVTNALLDATFAGFERRELEMLNGAVGRITANLADEE